MSRRITLLLLFSMMAIVGCGNGGGGGTSAPTLVSIDVTPANPSVASGTTKQFTATGTFSNDTTQDLTASATWNSSDMAKATISNSGLATGAGVGTATIIATYETVSGSAKLTVTAASLISIVVTPASPVVARGQTRQFAATGTYTDLTTQDITAQVAWNSSDTSIATISNINGSKGLATTLSVGTTTVTATDTASGIAGTATLTVTTYLMGGSIQGRQLSLSSLVGTLAGSAGISGSVDGVGSAANFSYPFGITTDGINLYVADEGNNTIRKIDISTGVVMTLAGTSGLSGTEDGVGQAARFSGPFGITTDGTKLIRSGYEQFNNKKNRDSNRRCFNYGGHNWGPRFNGWHRSSRQIHESAWHNDGWRQSLHCGYW